MPANAPWRRIDNEWLYSAETLALKLNTGINNTSLVLAFELPKSRKVLFFAGDAQRGNWISWKDVTFKDGTAIVTARSARAHRALQGRPPRQPQRDARRAPPTTTSTPTSSWMGQGSAASEFTAMITAVNEWAMTKNNPPWVHPLPSIREALKQQGAGPGLPDRRERAGEARRTSPTGEWEKFTERSVFEELYFDWTVLDE